MAFLTIQPTPGLEPTRRRRANRAGPPAAAVRTSYESLLRTAGFSGVVATDVTGEYGETQLRWMEATRRYEAEVRELVGDAIYDERAHALQQTCDAIRDGLLSRFLYTAIRP